MVGLVLVSHSKRLATGVRDLVLQTAGPDFPVAIAAGVGEDHEQIGTDAVHICEVLQRVCADEGVVVLMDLGSAVLSANMALELLDETDRTSENYRERVRLCPAPLVEGAIAAAVAARAGRSLDDVYREALRALAPKEEQLGMEAGERIANEIGDSSAASDVSLPARELGLTIENEHGLHARPAARLVQAASHFSAEIEITNETAHRGPAPARSLTSIALLQVRKGDRIKVRAHGTDAAAALEAIVALAAERFGEGKNPASAGISPVPLAAENRELGLKAVETPALPGSSSNVWHGIPTSEGIAIGPLVVLESPPPFANDKSVDETLASQPDADAAAELARLARALQQVTEGLAEQGDHPKNTTLGEAAQILAAEAALLTDPVVLDQVKALVQRKRLTAEQAWAEVTLKLVASYRSLDDPYLRERAADVSDLAQLVLRALRGSQMQRAVAIKPTAPAILFMRELLPSQAATYDPGSVLGVITSEGSVNTHSAIMLRALRIPMVTGVRGLDVASTDGKIVAMNGSTGEIWPDPPEPLRRGIEKRQGEWRARRQATEVAAARPAVTLDGERLEVLANVATVADAVAAALNGAEGIGVLRSELLFLSRQEAPTEAEQEEALRAILAPFSPGAPVVIRTLDAGADKPLAFLPQAAEHNPYLGVRGIRLLLRHPTFFLAHLKAILVAGAGHNLGVMFPMVSELREAEKTREWLLRAHEELQADGRPHAWPVQVGVMIEVPSAALLAAHLAERVEFLSIGTNDLTQYVLGAERDNASLAELQDALHPGVLHLVKATVEAARSRERHVTVCGDAASDPVAAAVFFGLGIRSLSVRPDRVAEIKARVRRWRTSELADLARRSLAARDAVEVRALAREEEVIR